MKAVFKLLRVTGIPIIMLGAILLFSSVTAGLGSEKSESDREKLEETLNRAAVACYAIEGAYPPSVEYLEENYRVRIDEERYTVKYELYASNLMPSITVLENYYE